MPGKIDAKQVEVKDFTLIVISTTGKKYKSTSEDEKWGRVSLEKFSLRIKT